MSSVCPRCAKPVYFAEKVKGVGGKDWHRMCMACRTCGKLVDSTTVAEHDGEAYCKTCHSKEWGPKGYGYSGGSATIMRSESDAAPRPREGSISSPPQTSPPTKAVEQKSEASGDQVPAVFSTGCPRCGKAVYFAEKIKGVGGRDWHKTCFRCRACGKGLDSTTCAEHAGDAYCKTCHGKKWGPKGVGYGGLQTE
eukprot:TRINITY_DN980_c0_g1_i1.p1 TRINITY_DN980_c0_g1~~TRINITY_DN980_c0_g1_i1.p1  ORF type:complete len:195 (-),score=22.05 TRINITY_DN980_c0_g1_i1:79-663(-)